MSRKFLTPIVLPADPINPLDAATKQYVDAHAGGATAGGGAFTYKFNSAPAVAGSTNDGEVRFYNWTGYDGTRISLALADNLGNDTYAYLRFVSAGTYIIMRGSLDPPNVWTVWQTTNGWVYSSTVSEIEYDITLVSTAGSDFTNGETVSLTFLGPASEVWIGPTDPNSLPQTNPNIELWYDTDAPATPISDWSPYDDRFVNVTGDVMTAGALSFGARLGELLKLYDPGFTIGMQASGAYLRSPAGQFALYRGGTHSDTALDPGAGGTAPFQIGSGITMIGYNGGSASPLRLIGGSLNNCYVGFYAENDAVIGGPGTRSGFIGFAGNANLFIDNDHATGGIVLQAIGASGFISFATAGVEEMRIDPSGTLLVNKTVANRGVVGHEMLGSGRLYTTTDTAVSINFLANIVNAAAGNVFASFRRNDTQIGSISCATTTTVAFNTSSDRRLKNILGPVEQAADRLKRLKVWHFAWKQDGTEQDGLIADEVAEVVPIAVTGEPDAVDEDGEIVAQQMDYSKLVPLLTAALQEALGRIDALTERVAQLEAAA